MSATNQILGVGLTLFAGIATATTQPVFGFDPSIAVAGFVGAAISILLQRGLSPKEIFTIALCGSAAALYLTSLVAKWVGAERDALPLIGLLLGLSGIYLFRRVSDVVQEPQHVVEAIRAGRWIDLIRPLSRSESKDNP